MAGPYFKESWHINYEAFMDKDNIGKPGKIICDLHKEIQKTLSMLQIACDLEPALFAGPGFSGFPDRNYNNFT
ncbi:MAG: hypothetical protein ACK55Z_28430 [bacterium]